MRPWFSLAACLLLGACAGDPESSAPERPNVVLVILDALRADALSSYGQTLDTSPALTALARNGVQFERVVAQSSWTLPSVGSLLTSRHPRSLGLYVEESLVLPTEPPTLAESLSAAGYRTLGVTANPNLNSTYNFDQGFDAYVDSTVVFRRERNDVPAGNVFYADSPLASAREVFAGALEFARDALRDRPCYLQLNVMEVHEHRQEKKKSLLRPEYARFFSGAPEAGYLRAVRQVTDDLGAFVGELLALPGWRDTLFVILSDHGEGLQDHPDVAVSHTHGPLLYDSQVRVPWILFWPGWRPARQRIEQPVRLLDLAPTLLDLLDIESPPGQAGISLVPLIEGAVDEAPLPEYLITETNYRGLAKIGAYAPGWRYFHNAVPHVGLPEHELQAADTTPNGVLSDQSALRPDQLDAMRRYVEDWEARHPRVAPTLIGREITAEERAQLQAIGYGH